MEIFDRIKTVLFKPKEEWTIIEAENASHAKVFTKYLLIMALVPALAFFAGEYLTNRSMYNEYIEEGTARIENSYNSNRNSYYNNAERKAELEVAKNTAIAEFEKKAKETFEGEHPFGALKWNIIFALCLLGVIGAGAYMSAGIINMLSNQFGAEKNFNRSFSLVSYSLTPLCIGGILYAFHSLASLAPYIGLYGLYLLYLGIEQQLKPAADKKNTCFVIAAVAVVGVWLLLAKVAAPEIQKRVMADEYIGILKENYKGSEPFKINAKSIEKQMEAELKNHKY